MYTKFLSDGQLIIQACTGLPNVIAWTGISFTLYHWKNGILKQLNLTGKASLFVDVMPDDSVLLVHATPKKNSNLKFPDNFQLILEHWDLGKNICIGKYELAAVRKLRVVSISTELFGFISDETIIQIWKIGGDQPTKHLFNHCKFEAMLALCTNYLTTISCLNKINHIDIWNIEAMKCINTLQADTNVTLISKLSENFLAAAYEDNKIRIWNYLAGVCEQVIQTTSQRITALTASPEGNLLVGDAEGNVYMLAFPEIKPSSEPQPASEEEIEQLKFG